MPLARRRLPCRRLVRQQLLHAGPHALHCLCGCNGPQEHASLEIGPGPVPWPIGFLGSLATINGTLGRQAGTRDLRQAVAIQENRTLALKEEELRTAKTEE